MFTLPKIVIPETVIKHTPDILTATNAVGVVVTAVLTGKATVKACNTIAGHWYENDKTEPTFKEKVKLTWKYYILPAVVGTATIASGIGSNRISAKRLAEATAVAALYADRVKALEGKFEEKFGKEKLNEAKAEIKDEQLGKPLSDEKMLCYEPVSKQYFRATKQELMMAELTANKIFQDNEEISMNKWLSLLPGCKPYKGGDVEGWCMSDSEGEADFNWSFYCRGGKPAAPWIDIQPAIAQKNGHPVLVINYGMWPMERIDWMEGDTNNMLRSCTGKVIEQN